MLLRAACFFLIQRRKMTTDIKQLRLQKIVDEVEDYAILLLDREGHIENWNKGAEKTKGYKASEIIGFKRQVSKQIYLIPGPIC